MPLPAGCHLCSPLKAGNCCQQLQVNVKRRDAAQHLTEQGPESLLYRRAISVQCPKGSELPPGRAPSSRPCLRAPKWPPFSSRLLVARRRTEPGPPPFAFCGLQVPAFPARQKPCSFRRQHYITQQASVAPRQSACFLLGGAGSGGWLPRERAKRKRRGGSGAGDVSSRAALPLSPPPSPAAGAGAPRMAALGGRCGWGRLPGLRVWGSSW